MSRAPKTCSAPDCTNTQPCPQHQRAPWQDSTRATRTISGSRQQRRAAYVMDRDDSICHICGYAGANEIDHVQPLAEGGADDETNLAPIHKTPCHRDKTQAEAQRARTPGG